MIAESMVLPVRIQYIILRVLYGRTMLSADLAMAGSLSHAIPFTRHAKTDAEIEQALDAHGNSILRLAYSYLHNMEDAEDVLQETMIRYMDKAPSFENAAHEKAWLLRVCANLSKNRTDYNNIRKTDELKEEIVAEDQEDLAFVWEAVKGLSEQQREVIHLFYQEGYSTAQIAGILKEKESTVRSHLKRGRDRLKEILKEEYDFD